MQGSTKFLLGIIIGIVLAFPYRDYFSTPTHSLVMPGP